VSIIEDIKGVLMSDKAIYGIDSQQFQQKRYEIAKGVLASVYTSISIEALIEAKQRDSVIFNCIQISDMLMSELGYYPLHKKSDKTVHNLSELLHSGKDSDDE
jgi:hypothetical protein